MNSTAAARMAINLMTDHGLYAQGWSFNWMRGKNTLGLCRHGSKEIQLSSYLVQLNDENAVRLVVLHEIAHALVGSGHGHDAVWQRKCLSIGGDGKRCADASVVTPKGAWVGRCAGGHETDQHRAPLRVKACGKCSRTWKIENLYTWHHHGRKVPVTAMPSRYLAEYRSIVSRQASSLV